MNILITGGAGFLGTLLTRAILLRGTLQGKPITSLTVTDLVAPTHPEVLGHPLLRVDTGDLLNQMDSLLQNDFDAVFHMASAVSGECEADFDLGLRSNLDATRRLLDGLRAQQGRTGAAHPYSFFKFGRRIWI